MNWGKIVVTLAISIAAGGPIQAAEGYITGVVGDTLDVYGDNKEAPIVQVPAEKVDSPIAITDSVGDNWLEIVVDGNYYFVRRSNVLISRAKMVSGRTMVPAAGQGTRLGLSGN